MSYPDPHLVHTLQQVIEFVGTLAFAISGLRAAANRHYDWFGGFVCGFAVAIGGGTIRDVMLGVTPFWMTSAIYIECTFLALILVVAGNRLTNRMDNTWLVFDTFGLALFTIAGIQKTIALGHPFWVAVVMGCITGSAGGVIRDVLLNLEPLIFKKEIYAMASVAGGMAYWLLYHWHVNVAVTAAVTFAVVCLIRFLAVRYHISLPTLHDDRSGNKK
ncbi:MAG: trimeric intracellular cation channel family protein [Prevotella sp.]|uniref:trimeric intracellular cation channel family protein n=1 Tax=Prevotella sp. AGR2160 TaxID=1280674 RepID=UPI000425F673|nr:trimeric intracellular cation channel family protein [Prevotella sp. AGR2160]MDD5861569.1 trimeric intracellular cation channel family protein [Prevotella sp.]